MQTEVLRYLAVAAAACISASAGFVQAQSGGTQPVQARSLELRPGLWEFTLSGRGDARRRVCLTPEMAKDLKTLAATSDPASDCKVSNERVTGRTRTFDLACTRPQKYRATVSITVHGPDHFVTAQDYVAESATDKGGREQRGRISVIYRRIGECR